MATEMSADPVELGRAAMVAQTQAQHMADNLADRRRRLAVFDGAFGVRFNEVRDTAFERYDPEYQAAMVAAERLVSVLEEECDALFQTAFAVVTADQQSAAGIGAVSPGTGQQPS